MNEQLAQIASDKLFIETLETRNMDSLDFHDVSVWGVKAALEAAYELGRESNKAIDLTKRSSLDGLI